jgi:hypothetical protein
MPSFKDFAIEALTANGYDADELLRTYESVGWAKSILTVAHEGLVYEFRCRGCCLNYEMVGRLEGGKEWLVVASLRLEDSEDEGITH